jgi:hypothetical protein
MMLLVSFQVLPCFVVIVSTKNLIFRSSWPLSVSAHFRQDILKKSSWELHLDTLELVGIVITNILLFFKLKCVKLLGILHFRGNVTTIHWDYVFLCLNRLMNSNPIAERYRTSDLFPMNYTREELLIRDRCSCLDIVSLLLQVVLIWYIWNYGYSVE